jgi:CHAD domain-containing protein
VTRSRRATARRITPLLARRVRHVLRHVPGAFDGDEEAIHELRVAARRLRAILPVLARHPEGRRVRRAQRKLRHLTRAFGESRDLDVVLPLLRARVEELAPSRARTALVERLKQARRRARRHMASSVAELDPRGLRRALRGVVERSDEKPRALERLHETRKTRGRELRALLHEQGTRFDADALHQIRIRARKLRYVAEAIDALHEHASAAPGLLRKLQDDLGEIHDTHVLAEWLTAQAGELDERGDDVAAAEARALARYFRARGRACHRAFLATDPAGALRRAAAIMKANERALTHAKGNAA